MSILIDLMLLAIIVACVWIGYKRGLIATVIAVLVIIISLAASDAVARRYSGEFTRMLEPFVSGLADRGVDSAREELGDQVSAYDICRRALENIGVTGSAARNIAKDAAERSGENPGTHEYKTALVDRMCEIVSYALTMTVLFLMLLILFTVVRNLISLEFRLPGLELINGILGIATGFIKGLIFVFFIAWLARFGGMLLKEEIVGRTLLLRLFMNANPLAGIFGI